MQHVPFFPIHILFFITLCLCLILFSIPNREYSCLSSINHNSKLVHLLHYSSKNNSHLTLTVWYSTLVSNGATWECKDWSVDYYSSSRVRRHAARPETGTKTRPSHRWTMKLRIRRQFSCVWFNEDISGYFGYLDILWHKYTCRCWDGSVI